MIEIQVDEAYQAQVQPELLEAAAQAVLTHQGAEPGTEMTIVVSDDAHLQELNRTYLGNDAPTDVLSFPAEETNPETGQEYLGDIILSYPRALEQSTAAGHAISDELQLLVVHGVLHLFGHDHAEQEEKARMWTAQSEVLAVLGSSLRGPAGA